MVKVIRLDLDVFIIKTVVTCELYMDKLASWVTYSSLGHVEVALFTYDFLHLRHRSHNTDPEISGIFQQNYYYFLYGPEFYITYIYNRLYIKSAFH